MATDLPNKDLDLDKAFGIILSNGSYSSCVLDIAEVVYTKRLDRKNLEAVLIEHGVKKVEDLKLELLDLVIAYINLILDDHRISAKETENIKLLKIYFKVKEGDFYTHKKNEVKALLHRQFERLYADNTIDAEEAIHEVNLQGLFDLGYDQFDKLKEEIVRKALERGANLQDLDTVYAPSSIVNKPINVGRLVSIPTDHKSSLHKLKVGDLIDNREIVYKSEIPGYVDAANAIIAKDYKTAIADLKAQLIDTPSEDSVTLAMLHINLMNAYFKGRGEIDNGLHLSTYHAKEALQYGHSTGLAANRLILNLEASRRFKHAMEVCYVVLDERYSFNGHRHYERPKFMTRLNKLKEKQKRIEDISVGSLFTDEEIQKALINSSKFTNRYKAGSVLSS